MVGGIGFAAQDAGQTYTSALSVSRYERHSQDCPINAERYKKCTENYRININIYIICLCHTDHPAPLNNIFSSCVAFRVNGSPIKYTNSK